MKKFVALARVSSREQQREGFSLDVQVDGLRKHAERIGGEIIKLYQVAETASKSEERKTFKELLVFVKAQARDLSGILFYKVDRAVRNILDLADLERLEADYGVPFIAVTQPTENTPAGRFQRRMLATMATFQTEQQSVDVREGHARRVQMGFFVAKCPYGYRNVRIDGRALVEVHSENGPKVKRIFDFYANHGHTLDSLIEALAREGIAYSASMPRFCRSKLYEILRDRAYIGEVEYHGQWHVGKHPALIDAMTWRRVQTLLGESAYKSHEMTYAGELIKCACCGRPISGELKTKPTKKGVRHYTYYRCAGYNQGDHPRVRVTEEELDQQMLALFDKMRIHDSELREWIAKMIRLKTQEGQQDSRTRIDELNRQLALVRRQQEQLVNLRLLEEIDGGTFTKKSHELRDRTSELRLTLEAMDRGREENGELAVKAFELSQNLREKWLTADYAAKRTILQILCLNFSLQGATLVPTMRKPFDMLAEGLISADNRGDRI